MVTPAARREATKFFRERHQLSERRACALVGMSRSTYRYERQDRDEDALRQRLNELAGERPRFGYRRLHALLVREGWSVNHKRIYRLYCELGLTVRRKRRNRVAQANRQPRIVPEQANEQWSMDFMSDSLADGRGLRVLKIVDDATRECLAMEVDTSLSGHRVVKVLERIASERQLPQRIVLDNGPEFTSRALDVWAYRRQVELRFIPPGKPIENAFIESFNGRVRDECFNQTGFWTSSTPSGSSRRGGGTITRSAPTAHWDIYPRPYSLETWGSSRLRRPPPQVSPPPRRVPPDRVNSHSPWYEPGEQVILLRQLSICSRTRSFGAKWWASSLGAVR